jgi:CheY-like chemotaxis protein/predicted regulator of Ras-like GTPase activity (Roadblock/LC7/MglB family)
MGTKRILLVDDEEIFLKSLKEGLDSLSDILLADICFSVDDAIMKIERNKYDLVITDIRMPYKSGIDLILYLKKYSYKGKIVVMSAYNNEIDVEKIQSFGIVEVISKPFKLDWFIDKLKSILFGEKESSVNFDSIDLLTVLQIINIEKKSLIIKIGCEGVEGYVYTKEGEIIQAEFSGHEGKQALLELIYRKNADISLVRYKNKKVKQTINIPFNELIFNIVKDLDEKRKDKNSGVNTYKESEEKENIKEEGSMFEDIFKEMETIGGFVAAGIYDGTGKILGATTTSKDITFEEAGEHAIKLYKAAREVCAKMGIGTTNFIETHTENYSFIHTCIVPGKAAMGVLLKRNANIGMVRFHMKKFAEVLQPKFQ